MGWKASWGSSVLGALTATAISACSTASDPGESLGTAAQALDPVVCDGPEDLGLTCGPYGRVCSANAQCVYPAACNSSASGPGVLVGNATVDATDTAADLAQLSGIWCVSGNLTIMGTSLTDLSSLSALVAVGNELTVQQNASLTSLTGLQALVTAGSVKVVANQQLTTLSGLSSINKLSGLEVVGNNKLTTLNGLAPVDITSSVSLTGNGKLLEVNALSGIVGSMFGYLHVQNEASLSDLSGFANVTSVGSSLRIFNSDALTNLHGLDGITRVTGELLVTLNDHLQSLDGLGAVTQLGSAKIQSNPLLDECAVSELLSRAPTTCTACTGQLACSGAGQDCSVPACVGKACGSAPRPAGTACSAGYCDAVGACLAPAVLSVFSVSDGSVDNAPSVRNQVFSAGEVISFSTRLENRGPFTFSTSSVRVVTTDPYIAQVWPYPIYTNQVLSGQSGYSYPWLRLNRQAPEGHVVSYALEVDYTIGGVQRTASLPGSFTVGPPNPYPGPVTLDTVRFADYDSGNAHPNDGYYSPGELIRISYSLRYWSDQPVVVQSHVLQTAYSGVTSSPFGSGVYSPSAYGASGAESITLDPSAPVGQLDGTILVSGTAGGEPFTATLPFSLPVSAP